MGKRGFTVVELLVAAALFSLLFLGLFFLLKVGLGARQRHEAHQRSYRAATLAVSHLRSELRGVQLLTPAVHGGPPELEAVYRVPEREGQQLVVDGSGTPMWTQRNRLVCQQGKLWRRLVEPPGTDRPLADLGPGGSVSFTRVNEHLLQIDVKADFGDRRAVYEIREQVLLRNQP